MTEESDGAPIDGAFLIAGPPSDLATQLAAWLASKGAQAALIGEAPAGVVSVKGALASRDDGIESVAAADSSLGGLSAVVYVPAIEGGLRDRTLADTDEDQWDAEGEGPIRTAYFAIQGAHECFQERGGSIVAVIPTIALTGAAGLVPFSTAAEGIRLLVKSAARAWGKRQIRVNTITAPIEAWGYQQAPEHRVPNRYGPATPDSDAVADIAGAVAMLGGPLSGGVTGATIGVDQGTVMAP